jgi:pimeloyl-ACP methyl ester carboxylesterase
VRRLVSLDGLGPLLTGLSMPDLLTTLLPQRGSARTPPRFASHAEVAERLRRSNGRLDAAKALLLARHSTAEAEDGRLRWLFDPTFRRSLPTLHGIEEWGACWARVTAPTLWIASSDPRPGAPTGEPGEVSRRMTFFPDVRCERIPETGHNLHHDAPAAVAERVEGFLGRGRDA